MNSKLIIFDFRKLENVSEYQTYSSTLKFSKKKSKKTKQVKHNNKIT